LYSWPDGLQYSLESAAENFDLSLKFRELCQQAQTPPDDLELRVAALKAISTPAELEAAGYREVKTDGVKLLERVRRRNRKDHCAGSKTDGRICG
jgi:hypothetical protein